MKKLIAVLTLLLAFSVSGNAQDKKMSSTDAAKTDAAKMTKLLALTPQQQNDFTQLFQMKYQTLNDNSMSQERKDEMSRIVEQKIRASLTPAQMSKLEADPEMMAKTSGSKGRAAVLSAEKKK